MLDTKIVKTDPLHPKFDYLKEASEIIARGGLVMIPTDTVYGVAANMLDKETLAGLCQIKQRPEGKPFSLHIYKKENVEDFAKDIPPAAYKLMDKFWPGPLTIILKSKVDDTIGIRMPDSEIALKIIELSGVPVVCPSANISGQPAPTTFIEAIKDMQGLVDFAVDAGNTKLQVESSVVDLTVEPLQVTREKAIKKEDIEDAAKMKVVLFVCTGNSCRSVMAEALLKKKLQEKGRQDIEVISAGIMVPEASTATEETIELLAREGIDVKNHQAKKITRQMLRKSDMILAMSQIHEDGVLAVEPGAKNRLFLLKEFAKINDSNLAIEDPIGRPIDFYSRTFAVIREAVERISSII